MLWSAVILGLVGSFHCIGMCGPIAMMLPVDRNNSAKKFFQLFIYHIGRLMAYTSIGLAFGLLGKGLYLAGMQQKLSIIIGMMMIIIVLIPDKKLQEYNFSKPVFSVISRLKSSLGQQFKKRTFKSLFIIGLLNGYLPCGMVYMALFGAIAMGSALQGSLYMILFGLGTIPLMTGIVYIGTFLSVPVRNKIRKVIPYIAVCIGILFILRGLGLGIPYISPSNVSLLITENPDCIVPGSITR